MVERGGWGRVFFKNLFYSKVWFRNCRPVWIGAEERNADRKREENNKKNG